MSIGHIEASIQSITEAVMLMNRWQKRTDRVLPNGTRLICHVPHVAPEAWFHELYAGLDTEKLDEYEKKFPFAFPKVYKELLKRFNGLNAFSDSLSVFGYRFTYDRVGDAAIQPYDLFNANTPRSSRIPGSWLFLGGYSWDGSGVFWDAQKDDAVHRVERDSTKILNTWDSLDSWLLSEVERLSVLYDENGVKLDPKQPTIPPID